MTRKWRDFLTLRWCSQVLSWSAMCKEPDEKSISNWSSDEKKTKPFANCFLAAQIRQSLTESISLCKTNNRQVTSWNQNQNPNSNHLKPSTLSHNKSFNSMLMNHDWTRFDLNNEFLQISKICSAMFWDTKTISFISMADTGNWPSRGKQSCFDWDKTRCHHHGRIWSKCCRCLESSRRKVTRSSWLCWNVWEKVKCISFKEFDDQKSIAQSQESKSTLDHLITRTFGCQVDIHSKMCFVSTTTTTLCSRSMNTQSTHLVSPTTCPSRVFCISRSAKLKQVFSRSNCLESVLKTRNSRFEHCKGLEIASSNKRLILTIVLSCRRPRNFGRCFRRGGLKQRSSKHWRSKNRNQTKIGSSLARVLLSLLSMQYFSI